MQLLWTGAILVALGGCVAPQPAPYPMGGAATASFDPYQWHVVSVQPVRTMHFRAAEYTSEPAPMYPVQGYAAGPVYYAPQPVYAAPPIYAPQPYYVNPPFTIGLDFVFGGWFGGHHGGRGSGAFRGHVRR